ncbi:MAG TPA: hypothetical protein VFO07_02815 [Roseiflexaceae bacterium]|nr:hypothetical protein [Roseiflexaceae bacterium]
MIDDAMRARAREIVRSEVKGGAFVQEWSSEQAGGATRLEALRQRALQHPMSLTEDTIIAAVQAIGQAGSKRRAEDSV